MNFQTDDSGRVVGLSADYDPLFPYQADDIPADFTNYRYIDGAFVHNSLPQHVSRDEILDAIIASVDVPQKPAEKIGFITVPIYDHAGNSIVWTFEPDPNYVPTEDGSYLHPFSYVQGMTVELGMFYTDGVDIWECIKSGEPADFTDIEYFEII